MTTSTKFRDAIEEDIVLGVLPPGTKLDEVALSKRFGVSRTPMREALRGLAERGFVKLIRNRGAFVAEISMPRLIEMFEVMANLEGMCGRLCARRMDATSQSNLLSAHEKCGLAVEGSDADQYYYCNEEFHNVIYQSCGNGFLLEQANQLRRRLQPYRRLQLRVPKRMRDSFAEHQTIVDAILAGDEIAADKALNQHVLIQGERFSDFASLVSGADQDLKAS